MRLRRKGSRERRIFVCYRQTLEVGHARRLCDGVEGILGRDSIFMDHQIPPGRDFVAAIEDQLHRSDVVLVVIPPGWTAMTEARGRRKLDKPGDYVRLELETALAAGIRVIPVLVGGASMPSPDDLPKPLRGLAELSPFPLRDQVWPEQLAELCRTADGIVGEETRRRDAATSLRKEEDGSWQWRASVRGKPSEVYGVVAALATERFPKDVKRGHLVGKPPHELVLILQHGYGVRDLVVRLSDEGEPGLTAVSATAVPAHKKHLATLAAAIVASGRADLSAGTRERAL